MHKQHIPRGAVYSYQAGILSRRGKLLYIPQGIWVVCAKPGRLFIFNARTTMNEGLKKFTAVFPIEAHTLTETLAFLLEMKERSGINPGVITTPDEKQLKWNPLLALKVVTGKSTEEEYISYCI